jgi:hypothetical protein
MNKNKNYETKRTETTTTVYPVQGIPTYPTGLPVQGPAYPTGLPVQAPGNPTGFPVQAPGYPTGPVLVPAYSNVVPVQTPTGGFVQQIPFHRESATVITTFPVLPGVPPSEPIVWDEVPEVPTENREDTFLEKAKDTLYQAGESLGFVKPVQNIEGPLAEIQDVRQEMGMSKMEQPIEKPLTERAMDTFNQTSENIQPYAERAYDFLHQTGETLGIVKPHQHIEGPLAEIQDVRKEMGWDRMEQPVQKSLAERAMETFNQVGETMKPYADFTKDTFYQTKETLQEVGEKMGLVKPAQKIEGPLAEIQDVRQDMGWDKMEQPIQKPLAERAQPYVDRAKESINYASEKIEPYTQLAKETLIDAGEKIGVIKPAQHIEGPLAEIQDVRQDMGLYKMEQPIHTSLTERVKETWNEAGERIQPYVEKSKESLQQAGETLGFVKPHQNIEGPLAEIQVVRQDMGWSKMEQPVHKPLAERAKETWNEAGERIEPYAAKAKETWNQAGERIQPYAEKAKDKLYEAGEQIGLVNNNPHIEEIQEETILQETPLVARIEKTHIEIPLEENPEEIVLQQKPIVQQTEATSGQTAEQIELFAERARLKMQLFNEQIKLMEATGSNQNQSQTEICDREGHHHRHVTTEVIQEIQQPDIQKFNEHILLMETVGQNKPQSEGWEVEVEVHQKGPVTTEITKEEAKARKPRGKRSKRSGHHHHNRKSKSRENTVVEETTSKVLPA